MSELLKVLMRRAHEGEVVLPEFQRDFVWKTSDVTKLLTSLFNGYPIGGCCSSRTQQVTRPEHWTARPKATDQHPQTLQPSNNIIRGVECNAFTQIPADAAPVPRGRPRKSVPVDATAQAPEPSATGAPAENKPASKRVSKGD